MALSTLFARRPDKNKPIAAFALFTRSTTASPETWTPEGTRVSQRYRALEGSIVVYTDADRGTAYYAAACLGCTFRAARNGSAPLTETDAADLANAHASSCRAMPGGVPVQPDDWLCR